MKNVPNFSVPISGRRVGVKGNKDNVLIFALAFFLMASLYYTVEKKEL